MRRCSHFARLLAAVLPFAVLHPAGAQEAEQKAREGAVADTLSTAMGLAAHVVDVNPLLPIAGIGFKAATLHYAEGAPETEKPAKYAFAAATWHGTAASNVCMTAVVLSGGSLLPPCLVVGVAWGLKTWSDSEPERRSSERCAVLREFTGNANFPCTYWPAGNKAPAETRPSVASAQELVAP
jgi:hypothetical protein